MSNISRQALAASKSLKEDLKTVQRNNSKQHALANPEEHERKMKKSMNRMSKKEYAQQKKLEKSYQKQRKRAEEKAMRLKASRNVGVKTHLLTTNHSNHPSAGTGPLPKVRSHAHGAGHSKTSDSSYSTETHSGGSSNSYKGDEDDAKLNKHRQNYGSSAHAQKSSSALPANIIENPNSPWVAYIDESTKYTVYFNEETNKSSWTPPSKDIGFRWCDVLAGEEPPKGAKESVNTMDDPEGLGSDWMSTEYQSPSYQRAEDYRRRVLFRGGKSFFFFYICFFNTLIYT
jgi:hypothetical protein